jgi:hypothetical protein
VCCVLFSQIATGLNKQRHADLLLSLFYIIYPSFCVSSYIHSLTLINLNIFQGLINDAEAMMLTFPLHGHGDTDRKMTKSNITEDITTYHRSIGN